VNETVDGDVAIAINMDKENERCMLQMKKMKKMKEGHRR
jgi:hypothetical protein